MSVPDRHSWINSLFGWLLKFFFWLLYNPFAWTYDWVAWIVSLGSWNAWVRTVIPFLSDGPILEIGHGPGHLQLALLKLQKEAYGLDLSISMGKIARNRLRKAHVSTPLVRGTAFEIPMPSEYFGSVVATFPTEYIASYQTLHEIMRVLKPNGRLVILPYAWITGNRWLDQLAAWIFRVTGQAPSLTPNGDVPSSIHGEWIRRLVNTAQQLGYGINFHHVTLQTSCVLIILAEKGNLHAN